jgi:hypothetical protein
VFGDASRWAAQIWADSFVLMSTFPRVLIAAPMTAALFSGISASAGPSNSGMGNAIIFKSTVKVLILFLSISVSMIISIPFFKIVSAPYDNASIHRQIASTLVWIFNVEVMKNKNTGAIKWLLAFLFINPLAQAFIKGGANFIDFASENQRDDWVCSFVLIFWNFGFYGLRWLRSHHEAVMYNLTIPIWLIALIGGLYILPINSGVLLAVVLLLGFPVILAIQFNKGVNLNIVEMYVKGVNLLPKILKQISRMFGKE